MGIATANEPSVLDPTILKRPGLIDGLVHFPNPSAQLRRDYFLKMHPGLDSERLAPVVTESDGMSFAQVREAYILTGEQSFQHGEDISSKICWEPFALCGAVKWHRCRERGAGFGSEHLPTILLSGTPRRLLGVLPM